MFPLKALTVANSIKIRELSQQQKLCEHPQPDHVDFQVGFALFYFLFHEKGLNFNTAE